MHSVVKKCIERETGIVRAVKMMKRGGEEELVNNIRECYYIMK